MALQSSPYLQSCVREVGSFEELHDAEFASAVNAFYWQRVLKGDFSEVAARLEVETGITPLSAELLRGLTLSAAGRQAVEEMLHDVECLEAHGLQPSLECVYGYECQDSGHLRTDVCSWHVDSATGEVDTWLCTYYGEPTEGLVNTQAVRHVDVPETRARLLRAYGGKDGRDFQDWLAEHCFDLHYTPSLGAEPYSFGVGNLWRVATKHDGCAVLPCIHRAPIPVPGGKRLLLIC